MADTYHILRRKSDNSIKSFGLGRGEAWGDPACDVEVVEGDFLKAEPTLRSQIVPDPLSPEDQQKRDERVAAITRLQAKAETDTDTADLLKLLGLGAR